jgi:hypothetical protein
MMLGIQIIAAQDKNPKQILIEESDRPSPEIESPAPASSLFTPSPVFAGQSGEINQREEKKKVFEPRPQPEIKKLESNFRPEIIREADEDFRGEAIKELRKTPYEPPSFLGKKKADADKNAGKGEGFNWRAAFSQSLAFLGVQHGYALVFQKKTRQALKGEFFNNWGNSVRNLSGWDDGNRFFTNYIAHPMQGSLTGFIYVQNSPQARRQEFGKSPEYWRSRMKAMLWSTAWSTQFELGPISQASIGNIGLKGHQAWGDIVITPTIGTAMMITEEALDRYLIKSIERRTNNFYIKIFSRMLFNPTRIFANLLRFKEPWYRDRPTAH